MGLVPLTVEVLLVFVLTAYLINKYARLQNQNVIVTLSTFVGWFFSFVIIFVLPLDVAITFYHKCNARELGNSSACELPGGYVSDDTLMGLWQVTYWSAQILTWIVLPLLQSYVTAGDFSFWGKLKAAVFNNVLYYGLYLFCFIVIMVYAVVKGVDLNFEHMKVIVISASNTFGLFLLVLLLGYGLVEVPRSLWHTGRKRYRLNKTYFDIEKLASDKCEAEENVKELYSELINRAIFLENIAQAENLGTRLELQDSWFLPEWAAQLWYVTLRRPVCKLIGLMLSLMTLFILVSECTFFVVSPTLSPAALLMDYAANRFHYKYTQFVAMALIFYLCACAYYTIFRLKIYKYYHLDPRGHTDENSMLFSAILLCRLTPPICLNFLGMIHLDSHVAMLKDGGVETQFTKLMGHLDVIPIIAKGINIYLPFCIIFLCAVHYFRIATYLLHSLGFDQYVEEDEFTKSMINSGKSLVQIEKNSIRRKTEVTARTERYKKHTKKMKNYKPLPDDERPMIGYEEDDEEESEALGSTSIQMTSTPQKSHPTSANFFDDM